MAPLWKKKKRTPTINPCDRQSAQLTDQALGTIDGAAQESSRITPTSTGALHACSIATPSHHQKDPAGSSPESSPPTQPTAQRRRAEQHYITDTTRNSRDTRHPPTGGPAIRRNWWTAIDLLQGGEGRGGEAGAGGNGAAAPQTKRLDEAASADNIARTAPRWGRSVSQGHLMEQAAQGGAVNHLCALAI